MSLAAHARTGNRWLGVLALLALVGLYAVILVHYATDEDCEVLVTGDVLDCFICAKLAVLGIDFPPAIILPEPPALGLPDTPDEVTQIIRHGVRETGARSPPSICV